MSLGLTGGETPPLLASITASPYSIANPSNCEDMAREVAEITKVLGPDVDIDVSKVRDPKVERAMFAALRGAIPYRWAVRWMTGAGRRDRELLIAVRAGYRPSRLSQGPDARIKLHPNSALSYFRSVTTRC